MQTQTKVTGVVLAGGMARRMGGQDKGLIKYLDRPLVEYALEAQQAVTDQVLLNANRNQDQYSLYGVEVINDLTDSFDGPLAGVYAAMMQCGADVLLVTPCDSPLVTATHLQKLLQVREEADADIAVAFDGQRIHPVFLALKRSLHDSLNAFLQAGDRKIDIWLAKHHTVQADFSDSPEIFKNINTLDELSDMETGFDSGSVGC